MATGAQQSTGQSAGRQIGEPDGRRYSLTTGPVTPQRPGGIPGSTTGAEGDTGREGVASLLQDPSLLPSHTGF